MSTDWAVLTVWGEMEWRQHSTLWSSEFHITKSHTQFYGTTLTQLILRYCACLSGAQWSMKWWMNLERCPVASSLSVSVAEWCLKNQRRRAPPKTNLFAASSHRFGLYANCRNSLDVFTCGFSWVKKYTVRATGEYSLTSDVPFSVKIIMYCSTNVEVESLSWQKVLGTVLLHQQFGVIVKLKNEAVARWKANLTVFFCVYTSPITTGSNAAPNHDTAFLTVSWPPTYTSTINWIKMSNLGSSLHKTCYHWLSWG